MTNDQIDPTDMQILMRAIEHVCLVLKLTDSAERLHTRSRVSALIIECPDWFRYNPASVPQPEPGPVPLAPVQLHPGRGHRRRG